MTVCCACRQALGKYAGFQLGQRKQLQEVFDELGKPGEKRSAGAFIQGAGHADHAAGDMPPAAVMLPAQASLANHYASADMAMLLLAPVAEVLLRQIVGSVAQSPAAFKPKSLFMAAPVLT